jgi:hypothetical protein
MQLRSIKQKEAEFDTILQSKYAFHTEFFAK